MKKFQFIVVAFFLILTSSSFAQSNPKVFAVISKASWCPACVQNEGKILKDVLPNVDSSKIKIVVNDLSDATTKEVSIQNLNVLGLNPLEYNATGVISFVDVKSKKKVDSIVVAKPTEEILKAFEESLK